MSFEDKLQQRFDSAASAIDPEPGSAADVRGRAASRTRNRRLMASALVLVAVLGIGSLLVRTPDRSDPVDLQVASAPTTFGVEQVTEADFAYLGAFMLPVGDWGDSRFAYGGEAAAFHPGGDPESTDGFDGSLFVSGHPTRSPGVAEVSIPAPMQHDGTTESLPIADVLRPFADITGGRARTAVAGTDVGGTGELDGYRYSGLEVIETAAGPRLAWTVWQYLNHSNNPVPGHGHSSVDLRDPDPQGPWFLGEYDARQTAGYLFNVPEAYATEYLDGFRLLSGLRDRPVGTGMSSGPPFFAFNAPSEAAPGERIDVLPLAFYDGEPQALDNFGGGDTAGGAEWITTADGNHAVIVVGSKGLGEVRSGGPGPDDCGINSGTHAGPYEPRVLFYDTDDIAALASGELEAWQLEPYRSWNPSEFLIPTCRWQLTSASFDENSGRLYLVQVEADLSQSEFSPVPVIHVFSLAG